MMIFFRLFRWEAQIANPIEPKAEATGKLLLEHVLNAPEDEIDSFESVSGEELMLGSGISRKYIKNVIYAKRHLY